MKRPSAMPFNPSTCPDLCEAFVSVLTPYEIRQHLGRAIGPDDELIDLGVAMARRAGSSKPWPVRQVQVKRVGKIVALYWLTHAATARAELRVIDRGKNPALPQWTVGPDGEVEEAPDATRAQSPSE